MIKNHFLKTITSALTLVLLGFSTPSLSQKMYDSSERVEVQLTGAEDNLPKNDKPEVADNPQMMKFAKLTYQMCYAGCHAAALNNNLGTIVPRIDGLGVEYFLDQWDAYDGDRKGSIASQMKLLMYTSTPEQMRAVAEVANTQKMPYNPSEEVLNSDDFKRGEDTYNQYCIMCHGDGGASDNPKYPTLKGQISGYLYEQMANFRDMERTNHNSAMMTPIARILSEQDYKDLATYLSGDPYYERVVNPTFTTGIGMPPIKGFKLPDTGHIFDTTKTFGEDSDYIRNPLSYTISESGMVTLDDNTKLMWERYMPEDLYSAFEAVDYCSDLKIDGYDDWRLPMMKELITSADYGNVRPSADTNAFKNLPLLASGIWALPVIGDHEEHIWHVGFPDGHIMGQHIYSDKMVRCVRANDNAAFHANAFVDNDDGTVTDEVTQLMWQQKLNYKSYSWEGAVSYCQDLDLAGMDDWHLPNVKEGVSIMDYNAYSPTIDAAFFPNTPPGRFFWLSTTDASKNAQSQPDIFFTPPPPDNPPRKSERIAANDMTDYGNRVAWAMEFIIGSAWRYTKDQEFFARCVRYPE